MSDKPNLATVAAHAGVSKATVSQVMRGTGRISEDTRSKVLEAARKVAYVPDARAAAMRSGANSEIGLLIHKIANPFNAEVISGVSDHLESQGYLVSVLDSRDDPAREIRNLEALIRNMRGGMIWVPTLDAGPAAFKLIDTHRVPIVTFLRRVQGRTFDHLTIENERAAFEATKHLIDLGHRKIAYVGGRRPFDSRLERIRGFREAVGALDLGEPLIVSCADTKAAGFDMIQQIRAEHPDLTGLVCNGDMVALGALAGLQRLGVQPGRDVSIVGFDDIPDAAIATPALTTMAVEPYQLGRKLAAIMLERIQNPDQPTSTVLVPAKLVVRQSTGRVANT